MKKEIKIYSLITIMILVCSMAVNAQQKPGSRDVREERRKIYEKIAERKAYASKMRASMPAASQGTTPAAPGLNPQSGASVSTVPTTPSQAPANLKPSQQPLRIPKQPIAPQQ